MLLSNGVGVGGVGVGVGVVGVGVDSTLLRTALMES